MFVEEWLADYRSAITTISAILLIAGFLIVAARSRNPKSRGEAVPATGYKAPAERYAQAIRMDGGDVPVLLPPAPGRPVQAGASSRPAVAVLPFGLPDDDPAVRAVAAELYEDILNLLAGSPDVGVIGGRVLEKAVAAGQSIRAIGQEIGAPYALTGDLRAAKGRIRLVVRLLETSTGGTIWAKNHDLSSGESPADTALAGKIAGGLVAEILRTEALRALRQDLEDLDARALVQRAWLGFPAFNRRTFHEIESACRLAIELEPGYPAAYGCLAGALALRAHQAWTESPSEDLAEAMALGSRAVELLPGDPRMLYWWGHVHFHAGRTGDAIGILEEATARDSSFAPAFAYLGAARILTGDARAGTARTEHALTLAPDHAEAFMFKLWQGIGRFELGDATGAERAFTQSINSNVLKNPVESAAAFWAWVGLASVHLSQDRKTEAAVVIDKLRRSFEHDEGEIMLDFARRSFAPTIDGLALVRALKLWSRPNRPNPAPAAGLVPGARRSALSGWFQRRPAEHAATD